EAKGLARGFVAQCANHEVTVQYGDGPSKPGALCRVGDGLEQRTVGGVDDINGAGTDGANLGRRRADEQSPSIERGQRCSETVGGTDGGGVIEDSNGWAA